MDVKEIQQTIDKSEYKESYIVKLNGNYMFDEVELAYQISKEEAILIHFSGCYKVHFNHDFDQNKRSNVKNMISSRKYLYVLKWITLGDIIVNKNYFYTCQVVGNLLNFEVQFKEIKISKVKISAL
ncbi:hypothetical protein [Candidatus Enterococcus lemimoniae]|uniref:DUF1934 domain-containing protein n=1 Tax=Candidatus Enterococcus lemimoniae TaxID=1834167 RepID=A0ABZ2T0L3_9ENTE